MFEEIIQIQTYMKIPVVWTIMCFLCQSGDGEGEEDGKYLHFACKVIQIRLNDFPRHALEYILLHQLSEIRIILTDNRMDSFVSCTM